MCRFIETIRVRGRQFYHLPYHNQRFNETRRHFFGLPEVNLADLLTIPATLDDSVYRCRVEYAEEILQVTFLPYLPRQVKKIKMVEDNTIDYSYKYACRDRLDKLFSLRGDCDEILIVKNGLITDTSIANVVFTDGCEWYTPVCPLLNGTHRRRLLDQKKIIEKKITPADLFHYTHIGLINAMLEDFPLIPVSQIEPL